jgi:hypothetical protein
MAEGERRKDLDWRETESTSDAVRRLTAIIDERNAKKRKTALAGGEHLGAGDKFADQPPRMSLRCTGRR